MKSILNYGVILLIAVSLGGCVSAPDEDPSTAWRLEMEVNETVEVNERITAFVTAIVDDRCPIDVECADPGVARASIRLDTDSDGILNFEINSTDQLEETIGNYKVTYILMRPFNDTRITTPVTKLVRFQIDELN